MTRIKRGVAANKRRKYILERAKGFLYAGHKTVRAAKERLLRSERHTYKSRRLKKRDFRSLWISRINGALDEVGSELNYSKFINLVTKSGSRMNRKSISEMAINDINSFRDFVKSLTK
jgi:large subunit ribosomal protein L20